MSKISLGTVSVSMLFAALSGMSAATEYRANELPSPQSIANTAYRKMHAAASLLQGSKQAFTSDSAPSTFVKLLEAQLQKTYQKKQYKKSEAILLRAYSHSSKRIEYLNCQTLNLLEALAYFYRSQKKEHLAKTFGLASIEGRNAYWHHLCETGNKKEQLLYLKTTDLFGPILSFASHEKLFSQLQFYKGSLLREKYFSPEFPSLSSFQKQLEKDSALIEFFSSNSSFLNLKKSKDYYALIVTPNQVRVVEFGRTDEIDENVQDLISANNQYAGVITKRKKYESEREYRKILEVCESRINRQTSQLSNQIWGPIRTAISHRTDTLFINPDGQIHFVPFSALDHKHGDCVGEHFTIHQITNVSAIAAPTPNADTTNPVVIFTNPLYTTSNSRNALENSKNDDTPNTLHGDKENGISIAKLPVLERGAESVAEKIAGKGCEVIIYARENATEQQLLKLNSPRILHIGTHGLFFPENTDPQQTSENTHEQSSWNLIGQRLSPAPMERHALLFAQSENTLNTWLNPSALPAANNHGVAFARELELLNLENTELVVLDACQSAQGFPVATEGVFGLKRAFLKAGSRHVASTLWTIIDQSSTPFFVDFYGCLNSGRSPAHALHLTQKKWFKHLRKTKGRAYATFVAGSVILDSMSVQ